MNRFNASFDRYATYGETIEAEIDGLTVTARLAVDDHTGAPWKEHDGHGPVTDWVRRDKAPGERVLSADGVRDRRFYDFAEACQIARRDGWGVEGGRREGESLKAYAARAAERDFEVLQAWCNDQWSWVGVVLSVSKGGVELDRHAASLWGIEMNYPGGDNSYLTETANELIDEALEAGRAALAALCECEAA